MKKTDIENFILNLEKEQGKGISQHQRDLVFRCFILRLSEDAIRLIATSQFSPQKEEYIIVSLLEDIDLEYIKENMVEEQDIEQIKLKHIEELMNIFRSKDPSYIELKNEINKFSEYRERMQETQEKMSNFLSVNKRQLVELQNEKQDLVKEIDNLKLKLKEREKLKKTGTLRGCSPVIKYREKTIKYRKPESFKEKILFLFTGEINEIKEIKEKEINDSEYKDNEEKDAISMLCNPNLSIEQVKEIKQGLLDGIKIKDMEKIANSGVEVNVMRELRKFICNRNGLEFTDVLHDEENEIIEEEFVENEEERSEEIEENLEYE